MKIVIMLLFLYPVCYADSIQKIWQISSENDIVSVEDMPVKTSGSFNDNDVRLDSANEDIAESEEVQFQNGNIEDLPLAKTFPLKERVISPRKNSLPEQKEFAKKETMQERVSQIQHAIEKEIQTKQEEPKVKSKRLVQESKDDFLETKRISEKNSLQHEDVKVDHKKSGDMEYKSIYLKLSKYFPNVHTRELYLASGFLFLLVMLFMMIRRKKRYKKLQEEEPLFFEQEWSKKFDRYSTLKGEVHQQFLIRKQNILFNSDFTQYQKAKALLELEKEYTDLEYIYLPKLFGNDFNAFIEAEKVLSSKPELRQMIQEFIEETLTERSFTKVQRDHILRNVKQGYRTSHYNWQFDEIAMQTSKSEEQGAYFLQ
jgi:hypothetical protein